MKTIKHLLMAWVVLCGSACSDDAGPSDHLVLADSGTPDDQAPTDIASDLALIDQAGDTSVCDPQCISADNPRLCTFAVGVNKCVECSEDTHCAANPSAIGLHCAPAFNWCYCTSDAECAGKRTGPVCAYTGICSCTTDADCTSGDICHNLLGGIASVCGKPCTKSSDCSKNTPNCDTAAGRCYACKKDSDCTKKAHCAVARGACVDCISDTDCTKPTAKHCDPNTQICTPCQTDPQCADHLDGPGCNTVWRQCGCASDADCKLTHFGPSCQLDIVFYGWGRCACKVNSDCAQNVNGPTCHPQGRCTCQTDADCTHAPYTACRAFGNTTYKNCQKP